MTSDCEAFLERFRESTLGFDGKRVVDYGDAEEAANVPHPSDVAIEEIAHMRESAYVRHCRNRSGEILPDGVFEKAKKARDELSDNTLDIAFKLQAAGRDPFLAKGTPTASLVCMITGKQLVGPRVKARAFFPTEAKRKRGKMMNALELILSQRSHRFDQFLTFTAGRNVPLEPAYHGPKLPKRMDRAGYRVNRAFKQLHARLSELNKQRFMKWFGAELIFRSSETGSLCEKDADGNAKRDETGKLIVKRDRAGRVLVHPHGHCILHLSRFLPKSHMRYLTGRIWQFWGHNWSIDGALENIKEVCKYAFKPQELDALTPVEVAQLDDALFQLHRVQPMGELRDQVSARRRQCLAIRREWRTVTEDGIRTTRKVLVVGPDWNARTKDRNPKPVSKVLTYREMRKELQPVIQERIDREARRQAEHGIDCTPEGETADMFRRRELAEPTDYLNRGSRIGAETAPARPVNRVIARLSPGPYFDRVSRPALLVWNYNGDLAALHKLEFVKEALDVSLPLVRAAEEKLRVHTSPVSRGEKTEDLPWQSAEDARACRARRRREPILASSPH